MVPRAAEGFADEDSLVEWRSVVRALSADGEPVRLDVNEQDGFSKGVPRDELTRTYSAGLDALSEVGPGQLIEILCHSFP
jgi:hypothetical protein